MDTPRSMTFRIGGSSVQMAEGIRGIIYPTRKLGPGLSPHWINIGLGFRQYASFLIPGVSSRVNTSQSLPSLPQDKDAMSAARNGFTFYKHLQAPDGHWPGEYGGPLFLLPGLVIGSYVSGMDFTEAQRMGIIRYLINRAHPDDGGWGM